jgi:hypothetical protein
MGGLYLRGERTENGEERVVRGGCHVYRSKVKGQDLAAECGLAPKKWTQKMS